VRKGERRERGKGEREHATQLGWVRFRAKRHREQVHTCAVQFLREHGRKGVLDLGATVLRFGLLFLRELTVKAKSKCGTAKIQSTERAAGI